MKKLLRLLPWLLVAMFAAEVVTVLLPKPDGRFHTREFGRLPVLLNGRVQPFDSVARNSLLQMRSTQDVPLEEVPSWQFWHHPEKLKPVDWLLEVMARPEQAGRRPIFLIHHPELLSELKLTDKGVEKSGLRYYTYEEVKPVRAEINDQARRIHNIDDKLWTPFQKQVMKLQNALTLYERLQNSLRPQDTDDFAQEVADYDQSVAAGVAALRAREAGQAHDAPAAERMEGRLNRYFALSELALPLIVPSAHPEEGRDNWLNIGAGLIDLARGEALSPAVRWFAAMASAYRHDAPDAFNRAVDDYRAWLGQAFEPELRKGQREFFFNDFKAFLHAMIIYLFAFLCAVGALLTFALSPQFSESLRRSAFWLIALAFVVHTFGLVFRMALEGRPPVTNLYSSAIFIGWGAVVLGLVLERVFKVGLGSAVASLAGFVTLIIAHNLALGGDTMEMLRAVLDTNFWLATHVTCVTIGYASTFVAGLLGIAYIFLGLLTPILSQKPGARGAAAMALPVTGVAGAAAMASHVSKGGGQMEVGKALTKMVYAIVCFATLFSFVGTVLGGIWADQSWGRFWGWDPKENGALIIVLWNALILHARWGGLVRERGLMNLAVFGNIVTSFSWFGVNMLSIGLHSYGFTESGFNWLMLFVGSQLAIIALGLLPDRFWASFRDARPTAVARPS